MHKKILAFIFFSGFLLANQYDYLLFSSDYNNVRRAIDSGANVNAIIRGSTPLYEAVRRDNLNILELLITRGAKPNIICHGDTALHKVVQFGNFQFAQILLKAGAKVDIKDIRGNTPLHYAVLKNDKNMMALLVKYGADMYAANTRGDTPARLILARVQIPAMQVQNKNLLIASSSFSIAQGAVGLSVRNPTNDPLTITNVALYINNKLIVQQNLNVMIAPRSAASLTSLSIPRDAYLSMPFGKNGVAKIKYGFAVKYSIDGSSKTLHESTKSTLKVY